MSFLELVPHGVQAPSPDPVSDSARSAPVLRSIVDQIGHTPLLKLGFLARDLPTGVEIFAKAEYLNPGGSVKDRAARAMILEGERSGQLRPGKTIIDATSGNTGIAYAMIGAARGYRVAVCLPANASPERKTLLRAFGATIIETDPLMGTDGAQATAREFVVRYPGLYFYPDQYNNDANWRAHYDGTAVEIWEQTRGGVTHFLAGLGTSGTFVGTARRLKEFNPQIQVISMQPDTPLHGLEGMKHLATAVVPGIYDPTVADDEVEVDSMEAQDMCRRLAREEGLFVGVSSGGNVRAALLYAQNLSPGTRMVTILCDSGDRYLADALWGEPSSSHHLKH